LSKAATCHILSSPTCTFGRFARSCAQLTIAAHRGAADAMASLVYKADPPLTDQELQNLFAEALAMSLAGMAKNSWASSTSLGMETNTRLFSTPLSGVRINTPVLVASSFDARRISRAIVAPNGCTSISSHIFWRFIEGADSATLLLA
jgi:hypothetical protein